MKLYLQKKDHNCLQLIYRIVFPMREVNVMERCEKGKKYRWRRKLLPCLCSFLLHLARSNFAQLGKCFSSCFFPTLLFPPRKQNKWWVPPTFSSVACPSLPSHIGNSEIIWFFRMLLLAAVYAISCNFNKHM